MSQSCVPSNTEPPKIYPNIGDIIGTLQYISMRTYSTSKIGPWEYRKLGIQGAGNRIWEISHLRKLRKNFGKYGPQNVGI